MAQGLWDVVEKGYEETPKNDRNNDREQRKKDGEQEPIWDETKEMQYQKNNKKDIAAMHTYNKQ